MNAFIRKAKLTSGALATIFLALCATTCWAQSPLFPNTTPIYYNPYGQGAYGRYGYVNSLPPAFRNTPPAFMRPNSAINSNYRSNTPGFYNSPYIQNNGNGAYFHPLGY